MIKKFAVEVKQSTYRDSEIEISITHNGFQWWTTKMDVEEWPEVVAAVESHLEPRTTQQTESEK